MLLGFIFKTIGAIVGAIIKPICTSFDLIFKAPVYFR